MPLDPVINILVSVTLIEKYASSLARQSLADVASLRSRSSAFRLSIGTVSMFARWLACWRC
jgi:hypothetical protein